MTRARKLLVTAVVVVGLLVACVCYLFRPHRTNKLFEFASATASAREYVLDAYLSGTFHEQKDLTVYGSPYTLGLAIRCHDGRFEPEAAVVAVRIMDASDGNVVFEGSDALKMQTQCDSNGRYCTYVTSEEIDLEFKD